MKRIVLIVLLACSMAATADTLRGVVKNGTTKRASAGDEVSLKRIANGMEDAGQTTTNAKGEFSFTVPAGQAQHVIMVKHQNVIYTAIAAPGGGITNVQVFETASEINGIKVLEHMMVLQADSGTLKVDELYTVDNASSPPRTKSGPRAFEVYVPHGAAVQDAAAQTPNSMPLKAGLAPTGETNKYAFAYPVRPGQTQFRMSYTLPYSGRLQIDPKIYLGNEHMLVVVPGSMNLKPAAGSVYTPTTDPQIKDVNMFVAANVTPQQQLAFEIQGSGVLRQQQASAQGQGQGQASSQPAQANRPGGGLGVPNQQPEPLHSGQWYFLGVLSLFLTAGAVFVYLNQAQGPNLPQKADGDRPAVLLEAMKEEIFQLETDRLQGKVSPQEYETAKAALDKTLQRAVARGKTGPRPAST